MSQEITTKVCYKDEIRKFTITKDTDYKTFLGIVKGFFPRKFEDNKIPAFTYLDEEGDNISCTSELEWKEAIKVDPSKILRITLKKISNT